MVLRLMLYYHYDDGKEKAMSVFALVVLAGIAALVVTIIGAIIITVLLLKRNQDRE
jgi:branched-subunit amino acid ABC-type transport system permease component